MAGFADLIAAGEEFGVFQFYLPFVLSFAVVYGIFSKVKIFGTGRRANNINLILSGIIALYIIGYTPVGITLAEYFGALFGGTLLVVVTLLGTMMILYVLGTLVGIQIPAEKLQKKWAFVLLLIGIVLAAGVFISSGGTLIFPALQLPFALPQLPGVGLEDIAIILMLIGTLAIVWWLGQGEEAPGKGK